MQRRRINSSRSDTCTDSHVHKICFEKRSWRCGADCIDCWSCQTSRGRTICAASRSTSQLLHRTTAAPAVMVCACWSVRITSRAAGTRPNRSACCGTGSDGRRFSSGDEYEIARRSKRLGHYRRSGIDECWSSCHAPSSSRWRDNWRLYCIDFI